MNRRRIAADYVLGLLDAEARRRLDELRLTDAAFAGAVAEAEAMLANAPISAAGRASDPEAMFARIMSRIVDARRAGAWCEERSGTAVRALWDDRTFLIRCAKGTVFPAHAHPREERMVVLDGELAIGARRLATGACEVAAKRTRHEAGVALGDCLMLVQYGD